MALAELVPGDTGQFIFLAIAKALQTFGVSDGTLGDQESEGLTPSYPGPQIEQRLIFN